MKITLGRLAITALVFAVLTMVATALANAEGIPPQCSNQITACGCTIGAPGNYTVENDLYASDGLTGKSGCIDIEGQNINLYIYYYNVIGPGSDSKCDTDIPHLNSGVGIHVLPSASNVAIYDDEYVCGWNYGVESEGNNVNLYEVYPYYNNVGLLLNHATNNDCLYCAADYNVTGVQISGGSGNSINNSTTFQNSQYGYWVDGSKENTLSNNFSYNDKTAAFYLGCSSKGQVNPTILCSKQTPTTGNSLVNNYAYSDSIYGNYYPGRYGIATERGAIYNNFNGNYIYPKFAKDIIDGNGNCVYNNYAHDAFSTASPSCIQ